MRAVEEAAAGAVCLYPEGSDSPFIGYGTVRSAWSWAVPVRRAPADEANPATTTRILTTPIVQAKLSEGLQSFYRGRNRWALGYTVSVGERAFVEGLLPQDHHLLAGEGPAPSQRLSPAFLETLRRKGSGPERLYHEIQFVSWDGESVLTSLVHVDVDGPVLSVEFVATALPPIAARYRTVDTTWVPGGVTIALTAIRATWLVPGHVIDAFIGLPLMALRALLRPVRDRVEWIQRRQQAAFDYAPTTSIRDLASDTEAHQTFQTLDSYRQARIVERLVIENLRAILEDDGYDTRELDNRITAVDDTVPIDERTE